MPTHEHLRTAMNEMARTTDPLSPTEVLHAARRNRTHRRLLAAVVTGAAVVAVTVGITVLSPKRPADEQPPAATGDAMQALRDSVTALGNGDYTFSRTGADQVADIQHGTVHLPDSVLIEHVGRFAMLRTGSEMYLRYMIHGGTELQAQYLHYFEKNGTPAQVKALKEIYAKLDGEHWVRTTEKKLTDTAAVDELSGLDSMAQLPATGQPDATGATALVAAVTKAERSGNVITGTVDSTKEDPILQQLFSDPTYLYGVGAKEMPYRATLDDQGRLIELIVENPAQRMASQPAEPVKPEPPLVIRISGYGSTPAEKAPAQVSGDLSKDAYDMLARDND
jgi:hypothetical protein